MSLLQKTGTKREQAIQSRKKGKDERRGDVSTGKFIEARYLIGLGIFLLLVALTVFIGFAGQSPSMTQILPKQISNIRVVSSFPFAYKSKLLTQRKEDQLKKRIAPVYRLDLKAYDKFRRDMMVLQDGLNHLDAERATENWSRERVIAAIKGIKKQFTEKTGYLLNVEDIQQLYDSTNRELRTQLFEESSMILKEILREGVYSQLELSGGEVGRGTYFYSIEIDGRSKQSRVLSEEEALRFLRVNIAALDIDSRMARTLFRLYKPGIKPNLVYDAKRSESKISAELEKMEPVVVFVEEGDTIIEPGAVVTPEQYEQLLAFRAEMIKSQDVGFGFNISLIELSAVIMGLYLAAFLYVKLSMPELLERKQDLLYCMVIVLVNLLLIRLVVEIGETSSFATDSQLLAILPYLMPVALGAILTTIILNGRAAIVVGILVSVVYALMLGSITRFLLPALIVCLVGVYSSKNIKLRTRVIRASGITGLAFALSAFFVGFFNEINFLTIVTQMLTAQLAGFVNGLLVLALLPLLQNVFRYTSDITLLEMTDFNHPLLRQLQVEAPGTYHHSLMVATMAERAAMEINANSLICRVGALFHDIGKVLKPEYFVENQKDGLNPHLDRNPSMSALVIKSHVREGLIMGKEHRLPKVVLDIIEQHHGTTLIKYFYEKAVRQKKQTQMPFIMPENSMDDERVDESTFRYEGPKPQFIESAIVMFADSVEAAGRAMKKVTPQSVEELVNNLCKEKFDDGQLIHCSLTLQDIEKIKKSLIFTLLNMHHARIEYPTSEKEVVKKGE